MIPYEGDDEEEQAASPSLDDGDLIEEAGLCEDNKIDFLNAQVLHTNLGGAGPDAGDATLVFGNVMPGTNLVVTALSAYTPNELNPDGGASRNGIQHGFGVINMASDSSVDLKFALVDSDSGEPKVLDSFLFTIFDADHGSSHESREAVTVSGFSAFKVSDDTALDITETATDDESLLAGGGVATFTSTMKGGKAGNPVSPMSLDDVQKMKTVVFLFEDKSEFLVTAGESGYAKAQGRNLLFAGSSATVCVADMKCSSMNCPAGKVHVQDAEFLICSARPCPDEDKDKCCRDEDE